MEMTYSVDFAFLEFEKEDKVTYALEICKNVLKDQGNMPQAKDTDRDTALMNSISSVFPTSSALLWKYHITKNVKSQVKPAVGTKQIKLEDEKMIKLGLVVENIMNACNCIINSSTNELYVKYVIQFTSVCARYPDFLKYVGGIILG